MQMKKLIAIGWISCSCIMAWGQTSRDAVKVGGGYNLLTIEDVFVPTAYLEYSRMFYPPIHLAIAVGYSEANDIELLFEDRDLQTFNFDFTIYYSFTQDHPVHEVRPGINLSFRSYKTDWRNRDTGFAGTSRSFNPGLGFVLNYDAHLGDLFLVGVKGGATYYNNNSAVYLIGGHLGFRF